MESTEIAIENERRDLKKKETLIEIRSKKNEPKNEKQKLWE